MPEATQRRLGAEDLLQLRLISEAAISPDGSRVCFVQTIFVPEENKYRSHLWLVPAAGGDPHPFTTGDQLDFAPVWSSDGRRIAFLSDRSGRPQIWVIPTTGGEAQQLTRVRGIGGRPVWSPDSRHIACTVVIGEQGLEPEEEEEPTLPPRERFTEDVHRSTTLPYKLNGVGYIGEEFAQVAVIDVDGNAAPRVLTRGKMDHAQPAWSPDGQYLAFSMSQSQVAETPDPKRMFVGDIGLVPVAGGAVRVLTRSVGPAYAPVFSPAGQTIAYVGHARQYGDYTQPSVWVVKVTGGEPCDVTAAVDRPFGDQSIGDLLGHGEAAPRPAWAPDGRQLYYQLSDSGMTHLVRIDMASGQVQPVTAGQRVIYSFSVSGDGRRAALCHGDPVTPNDVFWLDLVTGQERRLTEVNRPFSLEVALSWPERYAFPSGDVTVEGWILRPPHQGNAAPTPAVLQIHGGPMVMYGYLFFFEFQLLAASGITVVYANPRGSMGYGQAFTAVIRGDWGNKDYQDVLNAIRAAVARGGIDPDRLGAAGGSYGGFMVNWIIGHTDRFKTGVTMRSISNEYSFFGTSDFGFTNLAEFDGPPWQVPERYPAHSPLSYVDQVRTPLLMIHSALDLRTPLSEAEQFYTALKVLGQEVVLLLYPDENHDLSRTGKPWHRVHRLEAIQRWFVQRLEPM